MPATAARIGLITSEFRRAIAGPDSAVDAAYGSLARDTDNDEPFETFFDSLADAQAIANERYDLLRASRRRFAATITDVSFALSLDCSQTTPVAQVVFPDRSADLPGAVVEMTFDPRRESATLTVWG